MTFFILLAGILPFTSFVLQKVILYIHLSVRGEKGTFIRLVDLQIFLSLVTR